MWYIARKQYITLDLKEISNMSIKRKVEILYTVAERQSEQNESRSLLVYSLSTRSMK